MPIKKKPSVKKSRATVAKKPAIPRVKPIGVVTHFYNEIKVAIIKFKKPVKAGIKVNISGATTNFSQVLSSMQYDHKPIVVAPKGKEIGVKVGKRVREGDSVFLLEK